MVFEDACETNVISALSALEQTVLGAVFGKHAGQPFASVMTTADWAEEGLSRAEAKMAFSSLWEKGCIQAIRKAWGECLYYIPAAYLPILTLTFERKIGNMLGEIFPDSIRVIPPLQNKGSRDSLHPVNIVVLREGKTNVAVDLLHVLAWFGNEGLPLTRKGTLHKKAISQLDRMINMRLEDVNGLVFEYEHQELYPRHVAILLDTLLSLGLIQEVDGVYAISQDRLRLWTDLPWSVMYKEIYGVFTDKYAASDPIMQHAQYRLLLAADQGQWFSLHQVLPFFEWDQLSPQIRGWMEALVGWGFGEVGQDGAEGIMFRWLIDTGSLIHGTLGDVETQDSWPPRLIIQPDFELLVPCEAAPSVHWLAECCAELIHRDRLSVYRLSRESFAKTADLGISPAKAIRCLALYAMGAIHPHIELALSEWGNLSAVGADAILLKNRLPELDVDTAYCEDTSGVEFELVKSEQNPFRDAFGEGLVKSNRGLLQLEPVPFQNQKENILPDLKQVPDIWHNDWRKYHLSTARQIAAKAIEWQAKLGMKMEEEIIYVIPEKIHGHESWTLTGWNVSSVNGKAMRENFSPREWEEMCILLPEI